MKNKTYQNAVDNLKFSDDLYDRVLQNVNLTRRPIRIVRAIAIAAVITALLATTAAGVTSIVKDILEKRETEIPVETLGTQEDTFDDAQIMQFTLSSGLEGVKTHYMELEMGNGITQYQFLRGMLYNWAGTYYRITDDYRLETVEFQKADGAFYKGEQRYTIALSYKYYETEDGVVSLYHGALQKNEAGEVLINVYCLDRRPANIGEPAWPAYLDVQTGQIRDALPQLSPADFEGRICYTQRLGNGILISALVNEGTKQCQGKRYWVEEATSKIVPISLPGGGTDFVYNDTLYYQDAKGRLYRMDDSFSFHMVCEYETPNSFSGGLLAVMTDDGKLGIFDVDKDMTYVFNEIPVTKNELTRYRAMRCGNRIMLIKTINNWDIMGMQITQVGVLDLENRKLQLLEFENDLICLHGQWLDESRMAIIYKRGLQQYLCIYEFA